MNKILIAFVINLIKIYKKFISPLIGINCRFQPTCSSYCEEAVNRHGLFKGLKFSIKRVSKCHPWGGSGYDPVPEK
ncbi:MAG: membrane protein insertion efficiency factor YidD [Pseudomonadota bacterium]|nr:membrane protein insertion efficiency factor YidD [Pseudomonadota bacterium]